jgi:aspartyl/asparaginyl-tRNA synthetase
MKISLDLSSQIKKTDNLFKNKKSDDFSVPTYDSKNHYIDLTNSDYYWALLKLRHLIKASSDCYFGKILGATNVDLFMMTPSVSSPMGPGSDSEAICIKFGNEATFLTDSSQFGFEPLLLNKFKKVYCYLPSLRGENPDKRHLNQFYHCEAEILGEINDIIPIIEGYVKFLADMTCKLPNLIKSISEDYTSTLKAIKYIKKSKCFPKITFDEAVKLLIKNGHGSLVNNTEHGRDIISDGEVILGRILGYKTPFWVCNYDRDRVAFYQKPDPKNLNKVINADLIFPALTDSSFGGEVAGAGQRQNNPEEMLESLNRQHIDMKMYEWYIDLRKLSNYKTTSGFGLGIERFITWILCLDDIKKSIPYPRLKNIKTCP